MVIFSLASAHPHKLIVVLRCKTIFEDTMAGNLTSAYPLPVDSNADKISRQYIRNFGLFIVLVVVLSISLIFIVAINLKIRH